MARGRSISITAVVMDGPITEARCLSSGSNNAPGLSPSQVSAFDPKTTFPNHIRQEYVLLYH